MFAREAKFLLASMVNVIYEYDDDTISNIDIYTTPESTKLNFELLNTDQSREFICGV